MDGFSVTSLTSLSTSIINRSAYSGAELNAVFQSTQTGIASASLRAHCTLLTELSYEATQLEHKIQTATVISQSLQGALHSILTTGDTTIGKLHKQLLRITPENVQDVGNESIVLLNKFLAAYSQAFRFVGEVLASTDRSTQDGQLTSSAGQLSLQNAEKAFNDSAQVTNSLLNSNATNNNDPEFDPLPLRTSEKSQQVVVIPVEGGDAPPPYVTESPSSSPAGNDAPAGSSGNAGPFALFAKSVKAFASQLVSKPDPLVSALCQAINHGDVQQARGLLAQRPNVNGRNEEGNTPMHYAITSNNEDMLRLLLAAGASSKGSGWTALPALFQAASTGKLGIAKVLLENGADINEKSITGQPYFVDVLDGGNISGIEFLLKEGASSTTESPSGRSVLVQAVKKDNLEIVTLLLKYGANISASDITGSSLLAIAAEKKDLSMTKLLLEHGVNPNSTNLYGGSVLADAIWGGRVELAKLLLDRGANGDESFWSGTSLLVKTITSTKVRASDKTDLVRRLLQNGASVNNPWDGNAAVCKALEVPSAPSTIVELLLQHGTKPNEHRMSSGETLLLYAMDKGKKLEARALLRHGADPNASDEKGRTPLMQALVTQDLEMVKLLRQHRADVNVKATASVADIAKLVNRPDMLEVLGMAESG